MDRKEAPNSSRKSPPPLFDAVHPPPTLVTRTSSCPPPVSQELSPSPPSRAMAAAAAVAKAPEKETLYESLIRYHEEHDDDDDDDNSDQAGQAAISAAEPSFRRISSEEDRKPAAKPVAATKPVHSQQPVTQPIPRDARRMDNTAIMDTTTRLPAPSLLKAAPTAADIAGGGDERSSFYRSALATAQGKQQQQVQPKSPPPLYPITTLVEDEAPPTSHHHEVHLDHSHNILKDHPSHSSWPSMRSTSPRHHPQDDDHAALSEQELRAIQQISGLSLDAGTNDTTTVDTTAAEEEGPPDIDEQIKLWEKIRAEQERKRLEEATTADTTAAEEEGPPDIDEQIKLWQKIRAEQERKQLEEALSIQQITAGLALEDRTPAVGLSVVGRGAPEDPEQVKLWERIRAEQERKQLEEALNISKKESGGGSVQRVVRRQQQHPNDVRMPRANVDGEPGDYLISQQMAMEEWQALQDSRNPSKPPTDMTDEQLALLTAARQQQRNPLGGTGHHVVARPPPRAGAVPRTNNPRPFANNDELLRRGHYETREAISNGRAHVVQCRGCLGRLHAPKEYALVFCPNCHTVSPGQPCDDVSTNNTGRGSSSHGGTPPPSQRQEDYSRRRSNPDW